MKTRVGALLLSIVFLLTVCTISAHASGKTKSREPKNAIVVAAFGTTVPTAVKSIINIVDRVKAAYPETEVHVTFTSNIIRSVWKRRQVKPQKWLDMGIPKEVLYVKNIFSTIGDLQEDGYRNIIVQPTHMFFMEQSYDLQQYIDGLAGIRTMKKRWRPFDNLVMGRPALGMPGDRYEYHDDVEAAVATLADDAKKARAAGASLVYMGHGNEHWSTGIYHEVRKKMREVYPEVKTCVGVVEGYPGIDDILEELKRSDNKKIMLKPFMIVAGDHAVNDMAGEEDDSWKSILEEQGFEVESVLEGLGSNNGFADLFVDHIRDAAEERGIVLH
ncbi:MAG: sirohydrochlorin cobaltochelatase [Thermodesulfobacteriota bacterium]